MGTIRGVGHSFGANFDEQPEDIVSSVDLIRLFCDIVSKNGNLLIGVGPRPDGTIPELQQAPLLGLGEWLQVNGAAVYGSRPWEVAESSTSKGIPCVLLRAARGMTAIEWCSPCW